MTYYQDWQRKKISDEFLRWCEKIGHSGKDGVNIIIVDGLPLEVTRGVQSVRFDKPLHDSKQNTTME